MIGYTKPPKLILRFDLSEDKVLKVVLVLLNKHFFDNYKDKKSFLSKDGFMISKGNKLTLYKTKILTLPTNFPATNLQSDRLMFVSDDERYKYLKTMKNCLLEWSKSEHWKGYNDSDNAKISFTNKVWIIF